MIVYALIVLIAILATVAVVKHMLIICEPDEVLVVSGRSHRAADGSTLGFRVLTAGRALVLPVIETVERMDASAVSVPMTVQGAYSEGGIPLNVQAVASIKISREPALLNNAVERFLGKPTHEIAEVAKETLEGHLRGVLATLTPEEVNEDRLKFAERLTSEASADLRKLGIQLDLLKIQAVSDERNYLDSIGRSRIAEIVRTAEIAESDAVRTATQVEAAAQSRGKVAEARAEAAVQQRREEVRAARAQLEAKAKSHEERAQQAGLQARAQAEQDLQRLRSELERVRLQADVSVPADIERQVAELNAEGEAAATAERGRAVAQSLAAVSTAWAECGPDAMDMVVAQRLPEIMERLSHAATGVIGQDVTVIDGGDGLALQSHVRAHPAAVASLMAEIRSTLGVDIGHALSGRSEVLSQPPVQPRPNHAPVELCEE